MTGVDCSMISVRLNLENAPSVHLAPNPPGLTLEEFVVDEKADLMHKTVFLVKQVRHPPRPREAVYEKRSHHHMGCLLQAL